MAPFTTVGVAAATTPSIVGTFFSHYLAKRRRKKAVRKNGVEDPNLELAYDEGIQTVKAFLAFSAKNTLEETQAFTAMYVPAPTWVRKQIVTVPFQGCIDRAETLLEQQLQSYGSISTQRIGGMQWWKVRGRELEGEWIEMKKDYVKRKASSPEEQKDNERVMLYIHGGAYFFSSLDTHRYQVQRHARKMGGRVFSPAYRLAPQYPFPCALLDALASYLFLIEPPPTASHAPIHPSSIILAGDSAGGGCVLSLLICIRDLGLPMPAGANLLSPWVDLTHSFPSILTNAESDYIPGNGFHFRPSLAWPPVRGTVLRIEGDSPGEAALEIDEQIQLYCPNDLLTHPLVSPVNQGSLGGLCPLLIHSGGGELLRDEQIYLAHKAAHPERYPPNEAVLREYPILNEQIAKYKPTRVQLQVFDGCAHVIPTLSITTPAKYMYRSVANFNIWAITAAKKKNQLKMARASQGPSRSSTLAPEAAVHLNGSKDGALNSSHGSLTDKLHHAANATPLKEDDVQSEASSESASSSSASADHPGTPGGSSGKAEKVTVLGSIPPFGAAHIVRQRVSCHGHIREMELENEIPALNMPREHVGQVHIAGPVSKWLETRKKYETKHPKDLEKFRKIKADDYAIAEKEGFLTRALHGERPPQCALASWYDRELARKVAKSVDEPAGKSNAAMGMWAKMSAKPDEEQVSDQRSTSKAEIEKVRSRQSESRV